MGNRARVSAHEASLRTVATMHQLGIALEHVLRRGGRSPGIDGQTPRQFASRRHQHLSQLQQELLSGAYEPGPGLLVEVPKHGGGTRQIVVPQTRDRIAQRSALNVLFSTYFPRSLSSHSFGARRGHGLNAAIHAVLRICVENRHVVRGDIRRFYPSVRRTVLKALLREVIEDDAFRRFVDQAIRMRVVRVDGRTLKPRGIPQGCPLSGVLGDLYLSDVSRAIAKEFGDHIFYIDDCLIRAATSKRAEEILKFAAERLKELGLSFSSEKTAIFDLDRQPVRMLGYLFDRDGARPDLDDVTQVVDRVGASRRRKRKRDVLRGYRAHYSVGDIAAFWDCVEARLPERDRQLLTRIRGKEVQRARNRALLDSLRREGVPFQQLDPREQEFVLRLVWVGLKPDEAYVALRARQQGSC